MKTIIVLCSLMANLCLAIFSPNIIAKEAALLAPKIDVINIAIDTLTLNGVEVTLALVVQNPNAKDITVETIDYQLMVNDKVSIKGTIVQSETFPAEKERWVDVPATLFYDEYLPAFLTIMQQPSATYRIKGKMKIKEALQKLPFYHEGKLELAKRAKFERPQKLLD